MTSIPTQKSRARKTAKARRAAVHDIDRGHEFLAHFPAKRFRGAVIAGFWPLAGELDILPLLTAAHAQGHDLALPCTPPLGQPLTFRKWKPTHTLKPGPYDTREPYPEQPKVTPDLILLPLLAFTNTGKRLGYGGGFYDRTLAALRASGDVFACGVAYAAQEAPDLPTDDFDQPLDGILTEQYFRAF